MADLLDMRTLQPVRADWDRAITDWTTHLRAAGRPQTTIRLRSAQLRRLARHVRPGPWTLTGAQLVTYAASQEWGTESRRSFRAATRSFYAWAIDAGHLDGPSPASALPPVRETPPAPRPTADDALREALATAPARERLAIRLAAEMGLRRGEVAVVHERDMVRDILGWSLTVHGKGARTRVVPMPDGLAALVRETCQAGGGWAFPGTCGGHLSAQHLGKLVAAALPGDWTMHSLRHRFASRAWAATHDLLTVQQLLGHATPATTQRYIALDDERRRAVMLAAA